MINSTPLRLAAATAAFSLVLCGCSSPEHFRGIEARPNATMFSPLDLPAPNSMRTGSGAPGPDYWQQRADYVIAAELDETSNIVTGHETIRYTNNSPEDLAYIWLHLEQNLFRKDSIGSNLSPRLQLGGPKLFSEGCELKHVRLVDTSSLSTISEEESASHHDLDYQVYDTLARIELPEPVVAGGGVVNLDIAWSFRIPDQARNRFGVEEAEQGKIFELAQWFPAVAVYDDVYGWNTLQYLGGGEFYTNFGDYEVSLTVPATHLVGATGVLQNPEEVYTPEQLERLEQARASADTVMIRAAEEIDQDESRPTDRDRLTWRFVGLDVRTFAWASSAAFIYDACDLDGVLVQSLYPKEKMDLWDKSTQMLRTAIKGYNERWFPYPYPQATNVYGAEGGMEYPMIIFCRGRNEQGLYGVTTHEIGHNWFPMLISTDERRHAWMDEGFNTFTDYYSYGDWFEGEFGRRASMSSTAARMQGEHRMPIMTSADQIPRGERARTQYAKTGAGLVLLREQILGPERFDYAFRTYIRRWAFKSPRPADFFRTMEDAAGADLAWFWRGWFMETAHLDQAVVGVKHERRETDDQDNWAITLTLENFGELVMPVVLDVIYQDGSTESRRLPVEIWFNSNRIDTAWVSDHRVKRVQIDGEKNFPDVDRTNNTWARQSPWE